MQNFSASYKASGVDVKAGYRSVELIKDRVKKTLSKSVLSGIGGFGGLFELDLTEINNPVLVSGTDGVGTKLKLAFLMDKHNTVGIDCVAMCVNDVICCGARPLYFLDYIAVGKNYPEKVADIVGGIADGCLQSDCSLIGGETAEMPGFYPMDEYDLAGFCVGVVDKSKIIDNSNVKAGDIIIGLASSGVHSNGFSLIRRIFDLDKASLNQKHAIIDNFLGAELLTPTKIYVHSVLSLIKRVEVKSACHITGGGFYENIPRALPENLRAKLFFDKLNILPIFDLIMKTGNIPIDDMFSTFNMGIGFCVVVAEEEVERSMEILAAFGETAYVIGEVTTGEKGIDIC